MSNPEMINLYVDNLVREMTELLKSKVLLNTQLEFLQKSHNSLIVEFETFKAQVEEANKPKKRKEPPQVPQESF